MSLKLSIKSKKEKLNQKKFSKGNTPHLIDLVQSSQDDINIYSQQKIEKRSKHSWKNTENNSNSTNAIYTPNNLNYEKLKKSEQQIKQLSDRYIKKIHSNQKQQNQTQIMVETCSSHQLAQGNFDRSLLSYKVEGVQGIKYISQSHHGGRVYSELQDFQKRQLQKLRKQEIQMERICNGSFLSQENVAENKENEKEEAKQFKKVPRYFQEQLSDEDQENVTKVVKCFRCHQKGHIAKNCMQQQAKIQCTFCLQQHHQSNCDSSPCFKCCQPGHISQDCTSKAIQCRACHKRGHIADKCGVYIPLEYHNKNQQYVKKRFRRDDLKRLKCLNNCEHPTGHFNCFIYNSSKRPVPYARTSDPNKKRRYDDGY